MKVILLAGGFGTRLNEYTDVIPKPMVIIGGKPILWHIMQTYSHFGHKDFYVALGYKAEVIKEYFLNYRALNADFTVDLASGNVTSHQIDPVDWKVTLVNTGVASMTGGRVKRPGGRARFVVAADDVVQMRFCRRSWPRQHRSRGRADCFHLARELRNVA